MIKQFRKGDKYYADMYAMSVMGSHRSHMYLNVDQYPDWVEIYCQGRYVWRCDKQFFKAHFYRHRNLGK